MIVARLRLAPAGGTAPQAEPASKQSPVLGAPKAPRVLPFPSCSRQTALGRDRHVGRGDGDPFDGPGIDR